MGETKQTEASVLVTNMLVRLTPHQMQVQSQTENMLDKLRLNVVQKRLRKGVWRGGEGIRKQARRGKELAEKSTVRLSMMGMGVESSVLCEWPLDCFSEERS